MAGLSICTPGNVVKAHLRFFLTSYKRDAAGNVHKEIDKMPAKETKIDRLNELLLEL
jgi:hypothetical protein